MDILVTKESSDDKCQCVNDMGQLKGPERKG